MKKILIVDDSETVRQQVRSALTPAGYDILEASDGIEGLQMIRSNSDLSAILCDVNMPNMNGLEMIANAKTEGVLTPIIMLTSEGQPSLIRRARESGAKGWIMKPFKVQFLLSAIDQVTAS